jgi:hypothetical protein
VSGSILDDVKKVLGLDPTYTAFDPDIVMHINSVFATLNQLGIGPTSGFMIMGNSETWDSYLGDDVNLNSVKTYICMRVRMVFDPPASGFALDAMKEQIRESEWRLNVKREGESWTDPNPPTPPSPFPTALPWWETY